MTGPQPIRSSLLFSPVQQDQLPMDQSIPNFTPQSQSSSTSHNTNVLNFNHGLSNSISHPSSDPNISFDSSSGVGGAGGNGSGSGSGVVKQYHHRRRSDFRSKSTDQIISGNGAGQSNSSIITATVSSNSKFTNLNVSQPVLRPAPLAPIPIIPATRFDTITSYVDVIYQHHQQQPMPQLNTTSDPNFQSSTNENSLDEPNKRPVYDESNVVYLDPSDGIDGDNSFMASCPQCAMMVMTNFEPFPGRKSRKMAFLMSPVLLCWLPFSYKFGKKWMDVRHSCPKCQTLIAIYRK